MNGPAAVPAAPSRLRVVFVNRYYAPDHSATSQMLTDLAEGLVSAGFEVGVVCSRQLYENPRAALSTYEVIRGVRVRRVSGARFGRDRLLGRLLDYATFYLWATMVLLGESRHCDVLVLKTDPPLLSLVGWLLAKFRHVACVNWLQDIFPEVATRLAPRRLPRLLAVWLRWLRDRSLVAADTNVVLGARMREYLITRGVPAGRISVGENWADEDTVTPLPAAANALRRQLEIEDRYVVSYSGNLGRAHEIDTLVQAARLLRGLTDVVFLLTGGGVKMRALQVLARQHALTQMRFLPYQPRSALGETLAAGDVHIVTLLPQLEGLIVPSKFYGVLAAGRPVIFVGDPDGELARVIRESAVGLTVACGDGVGLVRSLLRLRADPTERLAMGARARTLFDQRFTRRVALSRWSALLTQAARHSPGHGNIEAGAGALHSNSHS